MNRTTFTYYPFFKAIPPRVCVFLLTVLVAVTSCKKNFAPGEAGDDKLVVLSEITAGDSVEVPIGKTLQAGGGGLIRFEKVNDAAVKVTESNIHTWILQPNSSAQFGTNPTTVFTSRRHFKPNTDYSIEIKHPLLGTATAFTHIPPLPELISLDTASGIHKGKDVFIATLSWKDAASGKDYYIIEALKEPVKISRFFYYLNMRYNYDQKAGRDMYEKVKGSPGVRLLSDTTPQNKFIRLSLYTEDVNTENNKIDDPGNPFRRIFFTDNSFNGQIYTTTVLIDRNFFTSTDPKQKGRIRIQLKAVSKELYDYLLLYEKYKTDFGSVPTNQLASPVGNIQNGLGVFGGSSRMERIFYFDKF